jgi:hypothetical protein
LPVPVHPSVIPFPGMETDLLHQRIALAAVIGWIRPITHREYIAEAREREPTARCDAFYVVSLWQFHSRRLFGAVFFYFDARSTSRHVNPAKT